MSENQQNLLKNTLQQPLIQGVAIDSMNVATKQWFLTLNWHRTTVIKQGFWQKLKKQRQEMDLELSCLLCDRYGQVVERVWFKNVRDQAESIRHQGDELFGAKLINVENQQNSLYPENAVFSDTYDQQMNQERIVMYLARIPQHIVHVVLILSSYTGHALSLAEQGHCQLMDDEGNVIFDVYVANLPNDCSSLWLATLTRFDNSWQFQQMNQPLTHHHLQTFEKQVSEEIIRVVS